MYDTRRELDGFRVGVSEARDQFAELVNRAAYKEERVLLLRRGRPIAALVPIEDVAYLEQLEDEYDLKMAEEARGESGEPILWEDIKKEFGLKDR
jgi:prevent-host-death family protein